MRELLGRIILWFVAGIVLTAGPAFAGSISLEWDPADGAAGYRIYYGAAPGQYNYSVDAGNFTQATLANLTDCTNWYLAVKAYNSAGESPDFSNEVMGWARPEVTSVTPNMQGAQYTMTIQGSNFQQGVTVTPAPTDTTIHIASVRAVSCNEIQALVTIEPTAQHVRPAAIGPHILSVENPDTVYNDTLQFEVQINPARFDVNRTDATTQGRLDGKDTAWIARLHALSTADPAYDPDSDFNGDGWIDGDDLAYLASNFGLCWTGTAWSASACPQTLR